jgi:hypothetical protein
LYRPGGPSRIADALHRAAERGKDVSVFVEVKARFDEELNIVWARRLEAAGINVITGLATLAGALLKKFPDRWAIFAEREFRFRGQTYPNRNPLLGSYAGADGIKTGQTQAGGFGLAASAMRDGPPGRYKVSLIAATSGSSAASTMKRSTLAVNESCG